MAQTKEIRTSSENRFLDATALDEAPASYLGLLGGPVSSAFPARSRGHGHAKKANLRTRGRHLSETERETVDRRAHAGASRTALTSQFGISRPYVYNFMQRYPKKKCWVK